MIAILSNVQVNKLTLSFCSGYSKLRKSHTNLCVHCDYKPMQKCFQAFHVQDEFQKIQFPPKTCIWFSSGIDSSVYEHFGQILIFDRSVSMFRFSIFDFLVVSDILNKF